MANATITQLPQVTGLTGAEYIEVVQAGASMRAPLSQVAALGGPTGPAGQLGPTGPSGGPTGPTGPTGPGFTPSVLTKAAATARANVNVPANDPDLAYSVTTGGTYKVEIIAQVSAAGGGLQANLNFSGTQTNSGYTASGMNTGNFVSFGGAISNTVAAASIVSTLTGTEQVFFWGVLVASAAGTLAMAWSQNTVNAAPTQVLTGSFMVVTRLA